MQKRYKFLVDILYFIVGTAVYSAAVNMFLSPNGISPGGFTGIAVVVNHLIGIPTGTALFAFNIPVLIIGYKKMGSRFVVKTAFVTILLSTVLNITERALPHFKIDGILASMFGGILLGVGLSLILLRGATTGGIDIVAKLINRKIRHLSVGKIILMADGVVIALNALVYKNAQSALYSVVAMYAATRMMDTLLYGADRGKIIYVITAHPDVICQKINRDIGRGVTRLAAVGGYTGESRTMLMCTVRVHEAATVHDVIKECDNSAFIVVTDAGEIIGEGFKRD
ncbi:MAG: YitT family protein [Clostridia bacterium]|nr:YitT family protein [Clostridia bacterium]